MPNPQPWGLKLKIENKNQTYEDKK